MSRQVTNVYTHYMCIMMVISDDDDGDALIYDDGTTHQMTTLITYLIK